MNMQWATFAVCYTNSANLGFPFTGAAPARRRVEPVADLEPEIVKSISETPDAPTPGLVIPELDID